MTEAIAATGRVDHVWYEPCDFCGGTGLLTQSDPRYANTAGCSGCWRCGGTGVIQRAHQEPA
jgi:DnaJ-class molecular chaperone